MHYWLQRVFKFYDSTETCSAASQPTQETAQENPRRLQPCPHARLATRLSRPALTPQSFSVPAAAKSRFGEMADAASSADPINVPNAGSKDRRVFEDQVALLLA